MSRLILRSIPTVRKGLTMSSISLRCAIPSLALLAMSASAPPANATVISSVAGANGAFSVSGVDLINQVNLVQPTFSAISLVGSADFGSNVNKLNDGNIYTPDSPGVTTESFTPSNGSVVTVTLNTSLNPRGYDISSIVSLTGTAQLRSGQKYDLEYSLVGSTAFTLISGDIGATVNRDSGANGEVQVTIGSGSLLPLGASGIDQLRFTFYDNPNQSMYREIDVFGSATPPPAPEPSSLLLLGFGTCLLSMKRRRSAQQAAQQLV